MNLQIDRFRLDVNSRTLSSVSESHAIRPKTLALLLFMIERQGQIVSKDQLLRHIWDDVTVNEGVIFQSVREIRQMFAELIVIQNHPRKGYQWVADVVPIADKLALQKTEPVKISNTPHTVANSRKRRQLNRWLLALILLCALLWLGITSKNSRPEVVILPLQNYVDRNDLSWLTTHGALKIADFLSNVSPNTSVIASPDFTLQASDNNALKATENWQLSTSVYGDVYDYKVVYALLSTQQQYEGVIFAHSIDQAMQLLVTVVLMDINQASPDVITFGENVIQNSAFAKAMVAYETDWETAIRELENYRLNYPYSVKAIQYLSRLYIWQGDLERALKTINTTLSNPRLNSEDQAELLFNLALVYQYPQPEQALEKIAQGITVSEQPANWLTRAKLEELRADIYYQQNQSVEALRGYLKAQSFYDQIKSPVKSASLQLKLAALYIGNQQLEMAKIAFLKAKTAIQQNEMSFLYATLLEFEMRHKVLLN
jgi:DNA-binding winged helix-turn-helix (wHTH) protein/tetratricopeptide (TPR) repeat protein